MSFVDGYLKRPHLISALLVLAAVLGVIGYNRLPFKLFPDTERPQVAVVTVLPGASAADVESDLTRPIERELSGLDQVRTVRSTSRDEVSAVTVEFRYTRDLSSATTDVANALEKVRSRFPPGTRAPILFQVSSATPAVMTLALRPAKGSHLDLSMVRQLAENPIRDALLQLPQVANAEVFGGHEPVILVTPERDALERYHLGMADVAAALAAANANQPAGLVIGAGSQIVLKRRGALASTADVARVVLTDRGPGLIRVGDVASVRRGTAEPRSAFHGNGEPAIAINIQRQRTGNVLETIGAVKKLLPELEQRFPSVEFSIPDSQEGLITLSISNMRDALKSSILMTVLVLFLFLASGRSLTLVAVSLPMTFMLTFGVMWLGGMELNIVTLTAITLAVGMLVDDSIVVVENIQRHLDELGKPVREAVIGGTKEILLADFAGTATTVVALAPIVFVGGYVQRVMRPLSLTLIIALLASFAVSVTIIPLLAPWILRRENGGRRALPERLAARMADAVLGRLRNFYQGTTRLALRHRGLFLLAAAVMFVVAARQMPLVGRDLMPPMDTGIVKVAFEADAGSSLAATESILQRMETVIGRTPGVESSLAMIGSEPDVISFGSGRTSRQGSITVNFVDRFHRKETIWQIEDDLRRQFDEIPGLRHVDVYDYGATPLSTIKAPVDVMVSGPDLGTLDSIGRDIQRRLEQHLRGATSIGRSWRLDSQEAALELDPGQLARYGISPRAVTLQLGGAVGGLPASILRVPNQDGQTIWVQLPAAQRAHLAALKTYPIRTPHGIVPLAQLGTVRKQPSAQIITHEGLVRTIDVMAFRRTRAISHLQEDVASALQGLKLPLGYSISQQGEVSQMKESFSRLAGALTLSLVLLFFSLVPTFRSWLHPITIMSVIPLGVIGAAWMLLISHRHACMPAMMGLILLGGIVVNNSILLLDFARAAREHGASMDDALVQAVGVRMRPILMTATSTIVGMIPIAMEWSVGLERLSPLAIVAIGGLLVATFLTMVYVPILYSLLEDAHTAVKAWFGGKRQLTADVS
ncbi:MAG: efflux RND transporter permease subunit [Acidobacteria bacterium]|nr:efflux RND transporter permease subunit [Acidobacteriota bacterium]